MKQTLFTISVLLATISVAAQSGGGFNLEQNVIGNGGWRSDGGGFTVLGTMGQSNAGSTAAGDRFHLIDGLWAIENPKAISPSARIRGRVALANGAGIPRVLVTITNLTTNVGVQTRTRARGYYDFADITTGANYVITVSHQHFQFEPNSMSMFISQDLTNVDFVAIP
jgi:hypothetical protein